ncbi:hypothetical protein [Sphingobacterium prati]|uniref:hypothetical protein n=1 Tax=Sphingobacterium prati TaxID=2737006 RepID=UPI00155684EC|nr:hypothetical protein [Sphingobacterium prati]NPE46472.1 hypothetical protein [Sphingobacterium prati]
MSRKTIIIFIPMNTMIPSNRIFMVPTILKGVAGTIFIFAVLTVISYQDSLPVDGKIIIGFPWEYYSAGTGYDAELDEYASFENFEPLKLIGNVLFAAGLYLIILLPIRLLFRKKKS